MPLHLNLEAFKKIDIPLAWSEQRKVLGYSKPGAPCSAAQMPCYGWLDTLFRRITGKRRIRSRNPLKLRDYIAAGSARFDRIGLFWASNSHFSLFFPDKQGNRTDVRMRRDGHFKCRLKRRQRSLE